MHCHLQKSAMRKHADTQWMSLLWRGGKGGVADPMDEQIKPWLSRLSRRENAKPRREIPS